MKAFGSASVRRRQPLLHTSCAYQLSKYAMVLDGQTGCEDPAIGKT